MIVVIAHKIPAAVAGRMKLWFIEIKPGIFLSGLKNTTATVVAEYLFSHCPSNSGLMIFISKREAPGYEIWTKGVSDDLLLELSGLLLVKRNGA